MATYIEFRNTEATRAGKGIQELRARNRLSREEFARLVRISPAYLTYLEEGHEDKISIGIIEDILHFGGIRLRSVGNKCESLKTSLLSITPANPPVRLI